jgi:hypothetical protein
MFIKLNEWYYDLHCRGYLTRPLVVNADEISDFHDTDDVDRGYRNAVKISLKNGRVYNVKETCKEILEMIIK